MGSPSYLKRTQGSKLRRAQRERLAEAQNWRCCYCGRRCEPHECSVEHVIPLSRGGTNRWLNQAMACKPCNQSRANRRPDRNLELWLRAELSRVAPTAIAHRTGDGT